jgi:hypothetical protein
MDSIFTGQEIYEEKGVSWLVTIGTEARQLPMVDLRLIKDLDIQVT